MISLRKLGLASIALRIRSRLGKETVVVAEFSLVSRVTSEPPVAKGKSYASWSKSPAAGGFILP